MEAPFRLTPSAKRPFDADAPPISTTTTTTTTTTSSSSSSSSSSSKRRTKPPPPPLPIPPGHTAFRFLCRVPIIGGVIGRSGTIISLIRQETGAKIRVEEAVSTCDERVILVVAPETPSKRMASLDEEASPAQEALLKVFERALEVEAEVEGVDVVGKPVLCRLLAPKSKVGSVMGKGGKIIDKIRKDTGAKIRVLPMDQLPACASPDDELIQIIGDAMAVKKALLSVSHCLSQASDKLHIASKAQRTVPQRTPPDTYMEFPSQRSSMLPPVPGSVTDHASNGHLLSTGVERVSMLDQKEALQEVSFRILCSNDKVGGVIGKGGGIVRALQNETGASISVSASVAESEERVITVSASESPNLKSSRAQTAVLLVFCRSVEAGIEKGVESGLDKGASVTAQLLVPRNQIGCLMGKGGAIIQEMRRHSGANIRIIGSDLVPKCASENEEVVQISGELDSVQDALFRVTSKLLDNLFPTKTSNGTGMGAHSSSNVEITPHGRVGPISPGLYPSAALSYSLDRQSTLSHSMDLLGLSNSMEHSSPPRLWVPHMVHAGNPRTNSSIRSGLTTIRGGMEPASSRSKSAAIVTNTTVDILVPENIFGLVYGEKGSNLSRIRQISGAMVTVHDPEHPGTSGKVIISGTPDQAQAAQRLLQAFILSGQPPPRYS